jgi:SAM-dependent methyltransferase
MKLYLTRPSKLNFDWQSLLNSYYQVVKPESVVLEIGSSVQERTLELSRHCHRLIGVEIDPERTPRDYGNIEYVTADWQNLSDTIQPDSIDVAVSSHVIEHVADDLKALNELFKILKPGGVALINTPNRKRLTRSLIEFFSKERQFPYWEHQREYIESDLTQLIKSSDFKQYEIKPLVFGLHGGYYFCFIDTVPAFLKKYSNYWQIRLTKDYDKE